MLYRFFFCSSIAAILINNIAYVDDENLVAHVLSYDTGDKLLCRGFRVGVSLLLCFLYYFFFLNFILFIDARRDGFFNYTVLLFYPYRFMSPIYLFLSLEIGCCIDLLFNERNLYHIAQGNKQLFSINISLSFYLHLNQTKSMAKQWSYRPIKRKTYCRFVKSHINFIE